MERLTEEEMATWVDLLGLMHSDHLGRAHEILLAAITEIREHRAARAADAERIKSVVEAAVYAEMSKHDNDSIQEADWTEIREAIAKRAAEQLATPAAGLERSKG